MRSVWLGLVLAAACGSNDDGRPSAAPVGGSGNSSGGSSATAGSRSRPSDGGGAAGDDGQAQGGTSEAGDGGIVYETAGAPALTPGVCAPTLKAGPSQAQGFGVAGGTLLAMTPDELSVAFSTGMGESLSLHVADRESTSADFVPLVVALPDGYEAASGVSLSSDGLKLVLVTTEHSGFGMVSRPRRGEAFGADVETEPFSRLNAQKPMSGRELGWPVLSSEGTDLYYLSYFGQGLVAQSKLGADGVFALGTEIDEYTLGGDVGGYKHINGLSVDQRAIFFYDELSQHAMALFRDRADAPFYDPVDLGDRRGAVPNADCTRIYSSVAGALVFQAVR